jgi:hypothetical protein
MFEPPVTTDTGAEGEPAEITAIHRASSSPFPPPLGNFPAPPGLAKNLRVAEKAAKAGKVFGAKPGARKRLLVMGGGAIAALLVLGGGFFAYLKLTAPPPPPPPRPKVVAKPVKAPEPVVVEPAKTPVAEAPKAEPVVAAPVVAKPVEPVAPPPPPPPPPASIAFKAWVENLKIMGVRSGSSPRVFIGGTSYAPGDLVNPQLGITFAGYKAETRMLIFKDASGAEVERRN